MAHDRSHSQRTRWVNELVAGGVAGLVADGAVHPVDTGACLPGGGEGRGRGDSSRG